MSQAGDPPRPVVLCVLDGWALSGGTASNAVAQADTPVMDRLWAANPRATLITHGTDVGLPPGQMGNSEVGHMNLGAGRVVMQELPRIDAAVADGSLANADAVRALTARLRETGGTAHLMGLLSPGGVHAHQAHIAALANALLDAGVPVAVHAFTDGRDTPPRAAAEHLAAFREAAPRATIATVTGRYYAMDRDRRWDRVAAAHAALVEGVGEHATDAETAVANAHANALGDEFVPPTVVGGYTGMADGDGLIMANFRADRVRQLLHALLDAEFDGFTRARRVAFAASAGMVHYTGDLDPVLPAIFPPAAPAQTLGEVAADRGLTQLRIAETEKYAHVTFFFNGGRETPFAGETRDLVPSPAVATYDQKPAMSAVEVTDRVTAAIESGAHDLIVINYANGDMVGHTGDLTAAVHAVETVDACLGRVAEAVAKTGGALVITADHGNADQMRDPETGQPHTAHTINPVPLVITGAPGIALRHGRLADVAPTVLAVLGLPQPAAMTGRSLITAPVEADRAPGHA